MDVLELGLKVREYIASLRVNKLSLSGNYFYYLPAQISPVYNQQPPSLTLGCGTDSGNYLSNNVNYIDLLNVKQVAKRMVDYERDE
jgi:hypothetical protein